MGVPGDVDDPEGEVGVAGDDVVNHRGDAALEVGVGGLHDDGDVDVDVDAVLGDAVGQGVVVGLRLRLLGVLEELCRAGGRSLGLGVVLGGLLRQGPRGGVGGGRGHGLPGDGGGDEGLRALRGVQFHRARPGWSRRHGLRRGGSLRLRRSHRLLEGRRDGGRGRDDPVGRLHRGRRRGARWEGGLRGADSVGSAGGRNGVHSVRSALGAGDVSGVGRRRRMRLGRPGLDR